jgi:hypothetical protein
LDIKSSLATMKGLYFLSLREANHPKMSEYSEKLNRTFNEVANVLNTIFSSNREK